MSPNPCKRRSRHGSSRIGVRGRLLKTVLLELGGKNALIACPDADIDKLVKGVDFGLTGSTWTLNLNTAHRAAKRIHTGYVWINNSSQHFMGAPFDGVKQSGMGREQCFAELLEFTYTKNVNLKFG